MVVAQLVEQSLLRPVDLLFKSSHQQLLFTVNRIEKTKVKKKWPETGQISDKLENVDMDKTQK